MMVLDFKFIGFFFILIKDKIILCCGLIKDFVSNNFFFFKNLIGFIKFFLRKYGLFIVYEINIFE